MAKKKKTKAQIKAQRLKNLAKARRAKKKKSGKRKTTKKRSTPKRKTTKRRKTNKKQKGGRKMGKKASRLSPINGNGLKVVTLGFGIAALAMIFTAPPGRTNSPYQEYKATGTDGALRNLKEQIVPRQPGMSTAGMFAVGSTIVGAGARMLNVKSISFVQFS